MPLGAGSGIFAFEGMGQIDARDGIAPVLFKHGADVVQVALERGDGGFGQDSDAVFGALAIAHDDLVVAEVDVFHPKAEAVHEAQTGTIEEQRHQTPLPIHGGDEALHLVAGENHRLFARCLGSFETGTVSEISLKNVAVKEDKRVEGLVLRRSRNLFLYGEMGEKVADVVGIEGQRVLFAVKEDKAPDPADVAFFSADGVVFETNSVPDLIQ